MNFGEALQALKASRRIKRAKWGGYWVLASRAIVSYLEGYSDKEAEVSDLILAHLADNITVAPAQPYQQDLLAEDWQIVD